MALAGGVLTLGVAYFLYTAPGSALTHSALYSSTINTKTMTQAEAQKIINQTVDKTTITKAVWLASGLSALEYDVLWQKGTERSGTSPLNNEKRKGKYVSKVCGLEVYLSEHKYESGTGWPSFYEVNKENIVLKDDYSWLGVKRTEVLSKCGEHLGHVFNDGPKENGGLRYCMNGTALKFIPEEE